MNQKIISIYSSSVFFVLKMINSILSEFSESVGLFFANFVRSALTSIFCSFFDKSLVNSDFNSAKISSVVNSSNKIFLPNIF